MCNRAVVKKKKKAEHYRTVQLNIFGLFSASCSILERKGICCMLTAVLVGGGGSTHTLWDEPKFVKLKPK